MTGSSIALAALGYKGVPFAHQGRSRFGVDCIGLVLLAASDAGLDLSGYDETDYQPTGDADRLAAKLGAVAERIPVGSVADLVVGDVLLFEIAGLRIHVGIYTGDGRMVHAYSVVGKVVEHSLGAKWERRLVAAFRRKEAPPKRGL